MGFEGQWLWLRLTRMRITCVCSVRHPLCMPAAQRRLALLAVLLLVGACTSPGTRASRLPRPVTAASASPTAAARAVVGTPSASPSSAYRTLVLPTLRPALTCAEAVQSHDVAMLVVAFRAARLSGRGAESCLAPAALAAYSDARCREQDLTRSPGPLVLYRCAALHVDAIPLDQIEVGRVGPGVVQLEVRLSGPGGVAAAIYEHLRVDAARGGLIADVSSM